MEEVKKEPEANKNQIEEIEIIDEIVEIQEITEMPEEKRPAQESEIINDPRKNKILLSVAILLVLVLIGLVGFLILKKYPNVSDKLTGNKYGFDYNINKIDSYDWNTLLTDKKVATALGTARKSIISERDPDSAWILEDRDTFVNEVTCGPLLSQKIGNKEDPNAGSMIIVTVMLCKNTSESNKLFDQRKADVASISSQNPDIKVEIAPTKKIGIGTDAYYYIINRNNPPAQEGAQPTIDKFAGLIFKRGPFTVRLEEQATPGQAVLSTDKFRDTLAGMIDQQLKRSLNIF